MTVLAVACNNVVALRSAPSPFCEKVCAFARRCGSGDMFALGSEGKSLFDSLKRINVASKDLSAQCRCFVVRFAVLRRRLVRKAWSTSRLADKPSRLHATRCCCCSRLEAHWSPAVSSTLPAAFAQAQKIDVAKKELDKLCHDPGSHISPLANQRLAWLM